MVVREGDSVTLRCVAKGSPEPSITWRREFGEHNIKLPNGTDGIKAARDKSFPNKITRLYELNPSTHIVMYYYCVEYK